MFGPQQDVCLVSFAQKAPGKVGANEAAGAGNETTLLYHRLLPVPFAGLLCDRLKSVLQDRLKSVPLQE